MNFNNGDADNYRVPNAVSNDSKSVRIKVENGECSFEPDIRQHQQQQRPARSSNSDQGSDLKMLEIGSKNSAFLPYKQQSLTVLTNLQRGNVQTHAKDFIPEPLSFHERVAKGEIDGSEINESNVNVLDQHGFSPLMWACFHGRLSVCQMLIENGAVVNFESLGRETALMLAATNGHQEIVVYLLSSGAEVDTCDENGNTALMYATIGNHTRCITALLHNGASLTKTNNFDDSPFRVAVAKNLHAAQHTMEQFLKDYIERNLLQQRS